MKFISLAAGIAVLAAEVAAMFDELTTLDSDNWDSTVTSDKDNVWAVTFYSDWCPSCQNLETTILSAVSDPALKDKNIKFGAVDIMAQSNLAAKFEVKGSPTVKVFGADKSSNEEFVGDLNQAELVSFLDGQVSSKTIEEKADEAIPSEVVVPEVPAMPEEPKEWMYNVREVVG